MKISKKLLSLILITVIAFSTICAFAAEGDVYDLEGSFIATSDDASLDFELSDDISLRQENYLIEVNDNLYNVSDVYEAIIEDPDNYREIVVNEKEIAMPKPKEELKVVEVSAINGEVTVTFDKEIPDYGTPEREQLLENLKLFVSINDTEATEVQLGKLTFKGEEKQIIIDVDKVEASTEGTTEVTYVVTLNEVTKDVTIIIPAVISPIELRTVESVQEFEDVEVEFGSEKYDLPTEVEVTLNDEEVVTVPVEWNTENVDVNVAETYVVEGTLNFSEVMNLEEEARETKATINVVVQAPEELSKVITSVDTINGQVADVSEVTELKFKVTTDNGASEEMTHAEFAEKFPTYTADFKYNTTQLGQNKADGKVKPTKELVEEGFKYSVEVRDIFDDKVDGGYDTGAPEEFAAVEVTDIETARKTITKVTNHKFMKGEDEINEDDIVAGEDITVVFTEGINALGEEVAIEDKHDLELENVKSSDILIAFAEAAGSPVIKVRESSTVEYPADVEFTVTFASIEDYKFSFTVKEKPAAPVATTIEVENVTVRADLEINLLDNVIVKDQYGNPMDEAEVTVVKVVPEVTADDNTYKFTEVGTYVVAVKSGEAKAQFEVEVIEAPVAEDTWSDWDIELVTDAEDNELDLAVADDNLVYTLKATYQDADVTGLLPVLNYEVSESDVVDAEYNDGKLTITAKTEGTDVITVTMKQGDFPGKVLEVPVTVVDSTIKLNGATFNWKVEKLPVGTELSDGNLAEYLEILDAEGNVIEISELTIDNYFNPVNQFYIITFDEIHGLDENGNAFETVIYFED